jgi:DNA-directed RNA polymerase subunit beta'
MSWKQTVYYSQTSSVVNKNPLKAIKPDSVIKGLNTKRPRPGLPKVAQLPLWYKGMQPLNIIQMHSNLDDKDLFKHSEENRKSSTILGSPRLDQKRGDCFFNQCFDKGRLKNFVLWFLKNYGQNKTVKLVEQLKNIGFEYASKAGISLGIDDLKIPFTKYDLIFEAEKTTTNTIHQYVRGEITGVERFQRLIDTWHRTSESLKQEVIDYFEATDILNPVYMMAFSGARGNISQVRQLVGMRGLMADPQGQIIDFPIRSNFREGLTLTEYLISSYGARKGIVDTALRTANAGYLTRRLVDVAQHVIISHFDCGTHRGIFLKDMKEGNKTIHSLIQRVVGRILARDLIDTSLISKDSARMHLPLGDRNGDAAPDGRPHGKVPPINMGGGSTKLPGLGTDYHEYPILAKRNDEITMDLALSIVKKFDKIFVRSPLTCETNQLICQLCYGWSLGQGSTLVSIGEAVGVVAAQSIGEPGTQLTMRTFHTGGVFSGDISDQIRAPFLAFVEYPTAIPGTLIRTPEGKIAFLTKGEGSFYVKKVESPSVGGLTPLKEGSNRRVALNKTPFSLMTGHPSAVSNTNTNTNQNKDLSTSAFSEETTRKFKIPSYTLLYIRNKQSVNEKEVIAQISTISRKSNATDAAELTIQSEFEGQFFSKSLSFREKFVGDAKLIESSLEQIRNQKKQNLDVPGADNILPLGSLGELIDSQSGSTNTNSPLSQKNGRSYTSSPRMKEGNVKHGGAAVLPSVSPAGLTTKNPRISSLNDRLNIHYIDKLYEAWTWGYAWVLSGKIYELNLRGETCFPKLGDLVNAHSSMNQTQWNFNFNNGPAKVYYPPKELQFGAKLPPYMYRGGSTYSSYKPYNCFNSITYRNITRKDGSVLRPDGANRSNMLMLPRTPKGGYTKPQPQSEHSVSPSGALSSGNRSVGFVEKKYDRTPINTVNIGFSSQQSINTPASNVAIAQPFFFLDILKIRFQKYGYILTSHKKSASFDNSFKGEDSLRNDLLFRMYDIHPRISNNLIKKNKLQTPQKKPIKQGTRTLLHWFPNQSQTSTGGFMLFEKVFHHTPMTDWGVGSLDNPAYPSKADVNREENLSSVESPVNKDFVNGEDILKKVADSKSKILNWRLSRRNFDSGRALPPLKYGGDGKHNTFDQEKDTFSYKPDNTYSKNLGSPPPAGYIYKGGGSLFPLRGGSASRPLAFEPQNKFSKKDLACPQLRSGCTQSPLQKEARLSSRRPPYIPYRNGGGEAGSAQRKLAAPREVRESRLPNLNTSLKKQTVSSTFKADFIKQLNNELNYEKTLNDSFIRKSTKAELADRFKDFRREKSLLKPLNTTIFKSRQFGMRWKNSYQICLKTRLDNPYRGHFATPPKPTLNNSSNLLFNKRILWIPNQFFQLSSTVHFSNTFLEEFARPIYMGRASYLGGPPEAGKPSTFVCDPYKYTNQPYISSISRGGSNHFFLNDTRMFDTPTNQGYQYPTSGLHNSADLFFEKPPLFLQTNRQGHLKPFTSFINFPSLLNTFNCHKDSFLELDLNTTKEKNKTLSFTPFTQYKQSSFNDSFGFHNKWSYFNFLSTDGKSPTRFNPIYSKNSPLSSSAESGPPKAGGAPSPDRPPHIYGGGEHLGKYVFHLITFSTLASFNENKLNQTLLSRFLKERGAEGDYASLYSFMKRSINQNRGFEVKPHLSVFAKGAEVQSLDGLNYGGAPPTVEKNKLDYLICMSDSLKVGKSVYPPAGAIKGKTLLSPKDNRDKSYRPLSLLSNTIKKQLKKLNCILHKEQLALYLLSLNLKPSCTTSTSLKDTKLITRQSSMTHINMKKGWVYLTKNPLKMLAHHKTIIYPGQKNNLQFNSSRPLYLECHSIKDVFDFQKQCVTPHIYGSTNHTGNASHFQNKKCIKNLKSRFLLPTEAAPTGRPYGTVPPINMGGESTQFFRLADNNIDRPVLEPNQKLLTNLVLANLASLGAPPFGGEGSRVESELAYANSERVIGVRQLRDLRSTSGPTEISSRLFLLNKVSDKKLRLDFMQEKRTLLLAYLNQLQSDRVPSPFGGGPGRAYQREHSPAYKSLSTNTTIVLLIQPIEEYMQMNNKELKTYVSEATLKEAPVSKKHYVGGNRHPYQKRSQSLLVSPYLSSLLKKRLFHTQQFNKQKLGSQSLSKFPTSDIQIYPMSYKYKYKSYNYKSIDNNFAIETSLGNKKIHTPYYRGLNRQKRPINLSPFFLSYSRPMGLDSIFKDQDVSLSYLPFSNFDHLVFPLISSYLSSFFNLFLTLKRNMVHKPAGLNNMEELTHNLNYDFISRLVESPCFCFQNIFQLKNPILTFENLQRDFFGANPSWRSRARIPKISSNTGELSPINKVIQKKNPVGLNLSNKSSTLFAYSQRNEMFLGVKPLAKTNVFSPFKGEVVLLNVTKGCMVLTSSNLTSYYLAPKEANSNRYGVLKTSSYPINNILVRFLNMTDIKLAPAIESQFNNISNLEPSLVTNSLSDLSPLRGGQIRELNGQKPILPPDGGEQTSTIAGLPAPSIGGGPPSRAGGLPPQVAPP